MIVPTDIIAALIFALTVLGWLWTRSKGGPIEPTEYLDWEAPLAPRPDPSTFHERLELYRAECQALGRNAYVWVSLIGLTLLILVKGGQESYQILSILIPPIAIHAFVILCMLFLWMQFGWMLRHLIYERMALWKLLERIEGPLENGLVRLDSLRPLLQGSGFMDNWFRAFLPNFTIAAPKRAKFTELVNILILVPAAWLIGLTHASPIALLANLDSLLEGQSSRSFWIIGGEALVALLVLTCYLYFLCERHGKWFFPTCALSAAIAIIWLFPAVRAHAPPSTKSASRLPTGTTFTCNVLPTTNARTPPDSAKSLP